jgi:malate dehydrogenase (oxaloacetate-decarboxylating)(NADP+)
VVYAEGEEETVLRAVQTVIDEGLARPILIGRPEVIESASSARPAHAVRGQDFELTNIDDDPRFNEYWQLYHEIMQRRGVSPMPRRSPWCAPAPP